MNDSERAANFVREWNAERADQAHRDRMHTGSPVKPDGKFGMDGYSICGAVLGGLYGALNAGFLGGVIGAGIGTALVLIVLGPFWLLHRWRKR